MSSCYRFRDFNKYFVYFGFVYNFGFHRHLFLGIPNLETILFKIEKFQNMRQWFCVTPNFASFGVLRLRFTTKVYILGVNEHCVSFLPISTWHDITKTRFSKLKVLHGFYWKIVESAKSMIGNVLRITVIPNEGFSSAEFMVPSKK